MRKQNIPKALLTRSARLAKPWMLILCATAVWMLDSLYRGSLADAALARAGYTERTTRRNLWPRSCGILDYEAVFWGQGPRAEEAQGYVCVGYFHPPEMKIVP
jgi:hypothetical protein